MMRITWSGSSSTGTGPGSRRWIGSAWSVATSSRPAGTSRVPRGIRCVSTARRRSTCTAWTATSRGNPYGRSPDPRRGQPRPTARPRGGTRARGGYLRGNRRRAAGAELRSPWRQSALRGGHRRGRGCLGGRLPRLRPGVRRRRRPPARRPAASQAHSRRLPDHRGLYPQEPRAGRRYPPGGEGAVYYVSLCGRTTS